MKIKYLFFIRNIRLVKFYALKASWDYYRVPEARSVVKARRCQILMWFTGAYILKTGVARYFREFKEKMSEYIA